MNSAQIWTRVRILRNKDVSGVCIKENGSQPSKTQPFAEAEGAWERKVRGDSPCAGAKDSVDISGFRGVKLQVEGHPDESSNG